ncbi:hypothetical protein [Lysinibacter cavernae]|uniref:Putative membrane protein YccC n=1 Tax=Lysinibacter cavernae TaxID=1640652 RepID=A0A7X5R2P8_9MICO|nr:hypothetical protein [Lysinibacter cavernae]NIH54583.1 putative membrane protein YccC [Lysinibacter cavernae]
MLPKLMILLGSLCTVAGILVTVIVAATETGQLVGLVTAAIGVVLVGVGLAVQKNSRSR